MLMTIKLLRNWFMISISILFWTMIVLLECGYDFDPVTILAVSVATITDYCHAYILSVCEEE